MDGVHHCRSIHKWCEFRHMTVSDMHKTNSNWLTHTWRLTTIITIAIKIIILLVKRPTDRHKKYGQAHRATFGESRARVCLCVLDFTSWKIMTHHKCFGEWSLIIMIITTTTILLVCLCMLFVDVENPVVVFVVVVAIEVFFCNTTSIHQQTPRQSMRSI